MENLSNRRGPLPVGKCCRILHEVPGMVSGEVQRAERAHPWLEDPTHRLVLEEVEGTSRSVWVDVKNGRWTGTGRRTIPDVDNEFWRQAGVDAQVCKGRHDAPHQAGGSEAELDDMTPDADVMC